MEGIYSPIKFKEVILVVDRWGIGFSGSRSLVVVAVLFIALIGSGCSSKGKGESHSPAGGAMDGMDDVMADDHDTARDDDDHAAPAAVTEVMLEANDGPGVMRFMPDHLEIEMGRTYKLTFRNTGALAHDFMIPDLKAHIEQTETVGQDDDGHGHADEGGSVHGTAKPDNAAVVVFKPESRGVFDLKCTIPGHTEAGMAGKVTVR